MSNLENRIIKTISEECIFSVEDIAKAHEITKSFDDVISYILKAQYFKIGIAEYALMIKNAKEGV